MSDLELREVGADEAPTVSRLIRAAFAEYEGQIHPPSGAHGETQERVMKKMESGRSALALLGGEPVGCVVYEPNDGYVYLGRLAVLPSHRRHGIGEALVRFVEERARALGSPRVQLGVRVALPHIQAWYESQGYVIVEEKYHPGFDEPTYYMMEKELSAEE